MSSYKVLVRQPQVQSHSVTYELGDGVTGEAPESSSVAEGAEFELAQCDATKEGFVFSGWNYLGDTHPAGYKMTMGNENIVLTAVWKAEVKEFTVTFYPNGGDWSEPRVEHCLSGESIDLGTITPPTRESYTFDGWSCGDRTYSSEETVPVLSDMEFTAQWEAEGGSDPITPVVPGPIFPGDEQEAIEIITDDGKDGSKDDKKTVLVIGIVVAIIAILAVMSVSKRE